MLDPRLSCRGRTLLLAVLALTASPPALAQSIPPARPIEAPPRSATVADHVAEASRRFGVPEAWIWAVMRVESNGNAGAISHAGAMGLMQIMPDTWTYLTARYRLGTDPFDRRANILGGAAYLREMHDRFGSPGFLAAYNAGPNRYTEYLARGRPLPAETRAYLVRLTPIVGGAVVTQSADIAQPDPNAWRRAGLFPGRQNSREEDESAGEEKPADKPVQAPEPAPPARRETIFVALSSERSQ